MTGVVGGYPGLHFYISYTLAFGDRLLNRRIRLWLERFRGRGRALDRRVLVAVKMGRLILCMGPRIRVKI